MWQTVLAQARAFGLAMALGAVLGLCYDLFRGLRRRLPGLTVLCDVCFCLVTLMSLLLFGLYVLEGDLRAYLLLGVAAAFWGYWKLLSRFFLPVFQLAWTPLWLLARGCKAILKFLSNIAKFLFAILKKWVTINSNSSVSQPPGGDSH